MGVTIVPITPGFAVRVFVATWAHQAVVRKLANAVLGPSPFDLGVQRRKADFVLRLPSTADFVKVRSKPEFRQQFRENKQAEAELFAWIHAYEANIALLAFLSEELCAQHNFGTPCEDATSSTSSRELFTHVVHNCAHKDLLNVKPVKQHIEAFRNSMMHKISEHRYSGIYAPGTYLISPVLAPVEQELLAYLCERCAIPCTTVQRPAWLSEEDDFISHAATAAAAAAADASQHKEGDQDKEKKKVVPSAGAGAGAGVREVLRLVFVVVMGYLIAQDIANLLRKLRKQPQPQPQSTTQQQQQQEGASAEAVVEEVAEKFDLRDTSTTSTSAVENTRNKQRK